MTISEVIEKLEKIREKYGDVPVVLPRINYGTEDGYTDIELMGYSKENKAVVIRDDNCGSVDECE